MPGRKPSEFLAGPARITVAEAAGRIQNALALAGLTMFASLPMLYHMFLRQTAYAFGRPPTAGQAWTLAVGQSIVFFSLALVCALVGFLYAHRLGLKGFGSLADLRRWVPLGLVAGAVVAPLSYFGFDRLILDQTPEVFPDQWWWALCYMAGSAMSQEVIFQFGLLTIGVYLLRWRRFDGWPAPAILIVSLLAVTSQVLYLNRLEFPVRMESHRLALSLLAKFLANWLVAETYLRKGLVAAVALRFGLGLRLLAYAALL